jgi:acetyl esterase/lipase
MSIGAFHYHYFCRMVNITGATLYCPIVPVYNNDGKNIDRDKLYECIVDCYKKLLDIHSSNEISIGGDSSGGGLTLLMPTLLKKHKLPLPERILLVNPLDDCNLDTYQPQNPTGKYIFPKAGLQAAIEIYAGSTSLKDPYVSPYYTDFSILPKTYLFYGTYDEALIGLQKLQKKLEDNNKLTGLYVYPKCFHDFFVIPIPESNRYIKTLRDIINNRIYDFK